MEADLQIAAQAAEFVKCFKQKGRVHMPACYFGYGHSSCT